MPAGEPLSATGGGAVLAPRPLRPDAYAPYGDVVMAAPGGAPGAPANQGTAARFDRLTDLANLRPGVATLNVAAFRCAPRPPGAFAVAVLEKHPASTQLFVPLNAARYVVLVALGGERPDLATLAAFVAEGTQAVSYHPGVWHHPLLALDAVTDFVCLVWEDGTAGDCVTVDYPADAGPRVQLPG